MAASLLTSHTTPTTRTTTTARTKTLLRLRLLSSWSSSSGCGSAGFLFGALWSSATSVDWLSGSRATYRRAPSGCATDRAGRKDLTLPPGPGIGAAPTSRDGRMDAQYPKVGEPLEGWRSTLLLKRDVFSTVERGRFRTADGEVDAVMRRIDSVPWWSRPIAGAFLRREARALLSAGRLGVGPLLLGRGRTFLIR